MNRRVFLLGELFFLALISAQLCFAQAGGNFSGPFPDGPTSDDNIAVAWAEKNYRELYLRPLYDKLAKYNSSSERKNRIAVRESNVSPNARFPLDYLGNYTGACLWNQRQAEDHLGNRETHWFWVENFSFSEVDSKNPTRGNVKNLKIQFVKSDLHRTPFYIQNVPKEYISGFEIFNNYQMVQKLRATVRVSAPASDPRLASYEEAKVMPIEVPVGVDGSVNLTGLKLDQRIGQDLTITLKASGEVERGVVKAGDEMVHNRGVAQRSTGGVRGSSGTTQISPETDPFNPSDKRFLLALRYNGDKFPRGSLSEVEDDPAFRCILQKMFNE